MILASARCPKCKVLTEEPVEDTALVVRCQQCSQMNIIQTKTPITGFCSCGRTFDDHNWTRTGFPLCPKRR